jgi:hypothetical protein
VTSFFASFGSLHGFGFVCVGKAVSVIIMLSEFAKEHAAPSECQGRWGV